MGFFEQPNDELARLNASFRAREERNNDDSPDPNMGNLTLAQVKDLVYSPWNEPGSPLQLSSSLTLDELVESSPLFRQARIFLLAIQAEGKVKATDANKNLNRKFVRSMIDVFFEDDEDLEHIHEILKAPVEEDVYKLHCARVLSQVAGLITCQKKMFQITKKSEHLLKDEKGVELFHKLLITYFSKFNINFPVPFGEESRTLQEFMNYTFFRLYQLDEEWLAASKLKDYLLLPIVRTEFGELSRLSSYSNVQNQVELRVIKLLSYWGFVEESSEELKKGLPKLKKIRTTPLFRKLFQFDLK